MPIEASSKQPEFLTPLSALSLDQFTVTNALGHGVEASWQALKGEQTGLKPLPQLSLAEELGVDIELDAFVGQVQGLNEVQLPKSLSAYDCRNNRLAWLALNQDNFLHRAKQCCQQYGAERVGLFLGTSTSGILETELAYANLEQQPDLSAIINWRECHNTFSLGDFVARAVGIGGPNFVISTACSSSAKVFASAARYIEAGLCDAAVVGGVDSLCLTTLYGFNSLELVATDICRPSDVVRKGLSIGEGAGFAILRRAEHSDSPIRLKGYGESVDAWHMSTPHPEGQGAIAAMQQALNSGGLTPAAIDYINLHGTATPVNDRVEGKAVATLFGETTPASSTKGWTGHTLGAAGITEAVFAALSLQHQWVPRSLNTENLDPEIHCAIQLTSSEKSLKHVLSNSFGFGGNNASLLLGLEGEV